MPFSRQTLSALRDQAAQDISTSVGSGGSLLRRSVLRVMGVVQAGLAYLHYGYLDWISKQSVPFTATDEFLEGWAALKGVLRKAATAASGTVTFTGTNTTVLPAGTQVLRSDGVAYTTNLDGTVSAGSVTVTVTAAVPAAAGNADIGTAMTLGSVIAGISSTGAVASALIGGADDESNDDLRSRMLDVYQNPPQGGAADDYVIWALQVAGVTRAWTLPNGMGTGTVIVYFMMDNTEAIHNGFPQGTDGVAAAESRASPATGDQLLVANGIFPLQPVTALVYATAPTSHAIAFTIHGVASGSQAAVSAAIADVFLREGSPAGTIDLAHIWNAIAGVSGVSDFLIVSPTTDITNSAGQIPTVGAITWT